MFNLDANGAPMGSSVGTLSYDTTDAITVSPGLTFAPRTVANLLASAYKKLGVSSRTELARRGGSRRG